jgi:hypothetical protein
MRITPAIFCFLFVPFMGAAKPKDPKPKDPIDEKREKAAQIFVEAEAAYKLQKYDDSLKGFQEAYELTSEPSLLFNIAQCYRQLNRLDEARKAYQSFIRDAPTNPLLPNATERLKEIDAEIARLAQKGTAQISAQQDPTQVFFDGEAKGSSPLTLAELEPGEHRITVKKEGFVDFEVVATIKPGETYELKVPQLIAVVNEQQIQEKTQHKIYFFGAAGLGGLGLASFVGGTIALRRAVVNQGDLTVEDENGDGIISTEEIGDERNKLGSSQDSTILFWRIAGGLITGAAVSATIGLVKKAKTNKEDSPKPKTEVAEVHP